MVRWNSISETLEKFDKQLIRFNNSINFQNVQICVVLRTYIRYNYFGILNKLGDCQISIWKGGDNMFKKDLIIFSLFSDNLDLHF